jgi:hypothetical protein
MPCFCGMIEDSTLLLGYYITSSCAIIAPSKKDTISWNGVSLTVQSHPVILHRRTHSRNKKFEQSKSSIREIKLKWVSDIYNSIYDKIEIDIPVRIFVCTILISNPLLFSVFGRNDTDDFVVFEGLVVVDPPDDDKGRLAALLLMIGSGPILALLASPPPCWPLRSGSMFGLVVLKLLYGQWTWWCRCVHIKNFLRSRYVGRTGIFSTCFRNPKRRG